ncbi:hypothetical protein L7F22_061206 [Adiantum nelumboides]|nr:hypothetical protein [Adiantum nelumboides]
MKDGIEMTQDKIKAIQEALAPTNAGEVSSFLGYVNFYRRFVAKLAELASPMYALTKKEAVFTWDTKCQEGFENIKEIISRKPILKQPKWNMIFHVHVDASGVALGEILAQPEGVDFPIYFASRRFSQAEQVYTTIEREALGMVFAVQMFRHYLLGNFFVFYVDHQALLYLINKVVIQGMLFKWMLLLQEFEFKIIYKPGKNHFGADFLSRATPKIEVTTGINDELPDACLFDIQGVTDDSDMARYLQTGELPIGWSLKRKQTLVMQSRNFTWAGEALYKLGKDGVLRQCVQKEERVELRKRLEDTCQEK